MSEYRMRSAVFCHAAEDANLARELGAFLELNCRLEVSRDEGLIRADYGLLEAVGHGLSADVVLVLLSPEAVRGAGSREEWEPVLFQQPRIFGTEIVFLLARHCKFPELIRRRNFFDLTKDRLAGQRALKRWVMELDWLSQRPIELPQASSSAGGDPELLEDLARRVVDRPGVEIDIGRELALALAYAHQADFEGVLWLNCANRSNAGMLGDVANRLGLRLAGTFEQNREELEKFCANRRFLFVFEHAASENRESMALPGKASLIFIAPGAMPSPRSLGETAALFSAWRQDLDACLGALGDAQYHLRGWQLPVDDFWQTRVSLGSAMFDVLKHCGRLAEACEVVDLVVSAVGANCDLLAARRLQSERNWILEEWGQPIDPSSRMALREEPRQLSLEFGGEIG